MDLPPGESQVRRNRQLSLNEEEALGRVPAHLPSDTGVIQDSNLGLLTLEKGGKGRSQTDEAWLGAELGDVQHCVRLDLGEVRGT